MAPPEGTWRAGLRGYAPSPKAEATPKMQDLDEEYPEDARVDEAFRLGPSWLTVGLRLETVSYGYGTLKWIGSTDFADGTWYGVELDEPLGPVNGQIDHGLFVPKCKPGYGIFLRETEILRGLDVDDILAPRWQNFPSFNTEGFYSNAPGAKRVCPRVHLP